MKKLIMYFFLILSVDAFALTVVSGNTSGATGMVGGSTNTIAMTPSVQSVQTTQMFVNSIFGAPKTIGQQVPQQVSSINGVPYDVWMAGPVLSRYYNTNMYTANRSPYGINTTLPLYNQTMISGSYSMGAY